MRRLIENMIAERDNPSSDPYYRAKERMDDAKARGGWAEMIAATLRRINATSDRAKLRGIVAAVTDDKRRLEDQLRAQGDLPKRIQQLDTLLQAARQKLGAAA